MTQTNKIATRTIDAGLLDTVRDRIAKLARKAVKLGCEAPFLVVGEPYPEKQTHYDFDGRPYTVTHLVIDVEFHGAGPRLAGWEFIASIEPGDQGSIVRTVPGVEVGDSELAPYRNADPRVCQHCNTRRHRKDVYIVRRTDEPVNPGKPDHPIGTMMQVGRNCLADFTGIHRPESAANFAFALGSDEIWDGCGGRTRPVWPIFRFLACAAASVREFGYQKSTGHDDVIMSRPTTKANTMYRVEPPPNRASEQTWKDWRNDQPTNDDYVTARKIIWHTCMETETDHRDFAANLRVILRRGWVDARTAGYAVAMIPYVRRAIEAAMAERAPKVESEFVGTVGEKLSDVSATVVKVAGWQSDWGYTEIIILRDNDGNTLVWKTGSCPIELNGGEQVVVSGKIKKHDTYQRDPSKPEIKQTVLTRCKLRLAD